MTTTSPTGFVDTLSGLITSYLEEVASPRERLSLLRWQIAMGHAFYRRSTMPGHVTTSAIILSPDQRHVLLIDHVAIGRWLQPGGHYEPADHLYDSAGRETREETGLAELSLHPWHKGRDLPFVIDSHDVPGKPSRGEPDHVHHDLKYLFVADPLAPLTPQLDEVNTAMWKPIAELLNVSPKAAVRLGV